LAGYYVLLKRESTPVVCKAGLLKFLGNEFPTVPQS